MLNIEMLYKYVTLNFPIPFITYPHIVATAIKNYTCNCDDTFVVTVRNISNTSETFNIVRVDAPTGWAQSLELSWIVWIQ